MKNITTALDIMNPRTDQIEQEVDYIFWEYIQTQHAIATVQVNSTCDNCQGEQGSFSFLFSDLQGWSYKDLSIQETQEGISWSGVLQIRYEVPREGNYFSLLRSPLNLRAIGSGNSRQPYIYERAIP